MEKNKLLRKYFKTYLEGKELFNKNKEKSCEILTNNLLLLNHIKKEYSNNLDNNYNNLLEQSEINSYSLIGETIESNIESEIISSNNISTEILFDSIEKGELSEIKKAKYGEINFNKLINNKTILHYAVNYSDITFLKLSFKLGARIDIQDNDGHTLLEHACLQLDPNMINFLVKYGADMKKHLYFRDGKIKYLTNYDSIDILILYKILLSYNKINNIELILQKNNKLFNKITLINNLLNLDNKIGINNYTIKDLLNWIYNYLYIIPIESTIDYLNIIIEELNFDILNKLGCPKNKIEIILVNLIPFIDNLPFNLSIDWILSLELKYLILNLLKNKKKVNSLDIRNELINIIWNNYIKTEIVTEDYIGILISQWITKIKI